MTLLNPALSGLGTFVLLLGVVKADMTTRAEVGEAMLFAMVSMLEVVMVGGEFVCLEGRASPASMMVALMGGS